MQENDNQVNCIVNHAGLNDLMKIRHYSIFDIHCGSGWQKRLLCFLIAEDLSGLSNILDSGSGTTGRSLFIAGSCLHKVHVSSIRSATYPAKRHNLMKDS